MCLKPLVDSSQRFSTNDVKLTQSRLDHHCIRLLKQYVPGLKKRTKRQKSNDELEEGDSMGALGIHTQNNLASWEDSKAHRGSDGLARSFDIQEARVIVQRPAVTRVFSRLSSAPEGY